MDTQLKIVPVRNEGLMRWEDIEGDVWTIPARRMRAAVNVAAPSKAYGDAARRRRFMSALSPLHFEEPETPRAWPERSDLR
jgi:hypothetical protein